MITWCLHQVLIGDKSFWAPFWGVTNESDLPMRWKDEEISELQDSYLEREVYNFRSEYFKEFELIFDTFREHKYE